MDAKELQIRELKDALVESRKLNIYLQKSLEESNANSKHLSEQISLLSEQVAYLTQKLFGTSSEKRAADIPDGQLSFFDEAEASADNTVPDSLSEEQIEAYARKKRRSRQELMATLPIRQIICDIPLDERICDLCGAGLKEIGREVVRRELEFIPAKLSVIEYVSVHYACPKCKETEEPFFLKAQTPNPLMKHSLASPSTVAWLWYQKYANGLPFYRQEKDWKQNGLELNRSTMANWTIQCAGKYLKPIWAYYHKQLIKRKFLMADETRVQVLKEEGRSAQSDSFMWLYRTGEDGLAPIILYEYQQSRAGYNASEFLKGFQGYLCVDGYAGYNRVLDIIRCGCWAHVRRYFKDAIPKGHEQDFSNLAVQGVEYCSKLFKYEESFQKKGYDSDQRKRARLEKKKPLLEAYWSWIETVPSIKNSRLDKAVQYAKNQKPYLEHYLEDGHCSFSNNLSEQLMKAFATGRKNWLFHDTPQGAESSAIIYSVVETARANGLNIYKYLTFLLMYMPDTDSSDEEEMDWMMPWGEGTIQNCKN